MKFGKGEIMLIAAFAVIGFGFYVVLKQLKKTNEILKQK